MKKAKNQKLKLTKATICGLHQTKRLKGGQTGIYDSINACKLPDPPTLREATCFYTICFCNNTAETICS